MRGKKTIIILLLASLFIALLGCASSPNYEGKVKVEFELEGGVYQNCFLPVTLYYDFEEGTTNLIQPFTEISKEKLTRTGYTLVGWYRTKTGQGDEVTYTDPWDFATDRVTFDGVKLYAFWERDIQYTYNVCYRDEKGETQILGTYKVKEGQAFNDYGSYASRRPGEFTPLNYLDENGDPWDTDFRHPGGETDCAINVYVEYLVGRFNIVRTARELTAGKSGNIYLMADIDLNGAEFNFGDYKGIFKGNDHTISNFSINYDPGRNGLVEDFEDNSKKSLCVSLFGRGEGAQITDVTFSNVTVDVSTRYASTYRIYVAPLFVSMTDCLVSNVKFSGTFGVSQLPSDFVPAESLFIVTDEVFYRTDEDSVVSNITLNVTLAQTEE